MQTFNGVEIKVIPTGVTAIKHPNKHFSVTMQARAEAARYVKEINKTLPLPRNRR